VILHAALAGESGRHGRAVPDPPGPWWNRPVWLPVLISAITIVVGIALFRDGEPRG